MSPVFVVPEIALPIPASATLIVTPQAHMMQESGPNTWNRCAGNKIHMDTHTEQVTVPQVAAGFEDDFPPGFPQWAPRFVAMAPPQHPTLPVLPQSPPALAKAPQQVSPALPLLHCRQSPPGLVKLPPQQQQPIADAQPQLGDAANSMPAGKPGQEKSIKIDGNFFYRHKLAFNRYNQLRIQSNATFDWVSGDGYSEQERQKEERKARRRQEEAQRFWNQREVWDHSGFMELQIDAWRDHAPVSSGPMTGPAPSSAEHADQLEDGWGVGAPAIPSPVTAPASPSAEHADQLANGWGVDASATPGPVTAPAPPSAEHADQLGDGWGQGAPAVPSPVTAPASPSAEHADQLEDGWGVDAPATPGPETAPPTLPAELPLLPDDTAADQVTGSDGEVSAAARPRDRPRQYFREARRQWNSSWPGTATPSQPRTSTHLLRGHAQQERWGTDRFKHAMQSSPRLQAHWPQQEYPKTRCWHR